MKLSTKPLFSRSIVIILVTTLAGLGNAQTPDNLRELRKRHKTVLMPRIKSAPKPPSGVFDLVSYPGPLGKMAAYLTPQPRDGKKHPLIIWRVGGFDNGIDEDLWKRDVDPGNDQTAAAYRKAGVPMLFPALRGGNDNPGEYEGYFGEVDDVIAAAKYARSLSWVDPGRVYFGGHSTGGTLALLVAESTDLFRAVISFGPVSSTVAYGQEQLPFDVSKQSEAAVRAPILFLSEITCPTLVLEGASGNINSLKLMKENCTNRKVQFYEIPGADHFGILAPFNGLLARKILADTGPTCSLTISAAELKATAARIVKNKE